MDNLMNLIKQHRTLAIVVAYVALAVVVIGIFVFFSIGGEKSAEVDPASGLEIVESTPTNEGAPKIKPEYFWPREVYAEQTDIWIQAVKNVIKLYARTQNIDLWRVSMVQGSYASTTSQETVSGGGTGGLYPKKVTDFKLVFNIDQVNLSVSVIETTNMSVRILNESGVEVFAINNFSFSSRILPIGADLPTGRTSVTSGAITLTSEYVPQLAGPLPPLETGDRVNLYYACPTSNFDVNACQVYKYDFYY